MMSSQPNMIYQVDFTCYYSCTKFKSCRFHMLLLLHKGLETNEKMREGGKQPPGFHGPKYPRPYRVKSNITKISKLHTRDACYSTTSADKHERQFNKW